MFADNLDEFDDARDVVTSLRDEYVAAESEDYVDWGLDDDDDDLGADGDDGNSTIPGDQPILPPPPPAA